MEKTAMKKTSTSTTSENDSNQRFLVKRVIELSSESTCHGYHNIFKTTYMSIRLMWILFVTASIAFFAWLALRGLDTYLQHDVTTKIRMEDEQSITMPKISICNSKPFMTKAAYNFFIDQMLKLGEVNEDDMSILYGNYTDPVKIMNFKIKNRQNMYLLQHMVADPLFNQTLRSQFGLSKTQFVLNQTFPLDTAVSLDYFRSFYDPVYGNCFQFNSGLTDDDKKINLLIQNQSGSANGFMGVFFVDTFQKQSYNFMNLLYSYTFGIRISFDDQDSIPLTYHNMNPIKPGACTYMGLKKTRVVNLPQPYSSCQDLTDYHSVLYDKFLALNKTYSQKVCFEMCKQKKVTDTCNCTFINFPNLEDFMSCQTREQIYCSVELQPTAQDCEQYCPLECESILYDYTTSADYFPDNLYFDVFRADERVQAQLAQANLSSSDDLLSYMALANSLACVIVYFTDMKTEVIEEVATMTVIYLTYGKIKIKVDLFAYIGGTLGLCCGMSILSFCEFAEIFLECIYIVTAKGRYAVGVRGE